VIHSLIIGRLASEMGWKYGETVQKLEAKRRAGGVKHLERLKRFRTYRAKAADAGKAAITADQNNALLAVRVGHV
jgi:hypothetical protein